ncbi:AMP-binding protein, partial [Roseateles sp. GG27B]
MSNALQRQGVQRGDRVAIVLPQRFETAVAHIAINQLGAVAMPLSMLFGPEALAFRLQDSAAVLVIADEAAAPGLRGLRLECPHLRQMIVVGGSASGCGGAAEPGEICWLQAMQAEDARFVAAKTMADEAAVLIYTSGTTGPPKGALIPQRALIGNLTGFVASQNWFGFDPAALERGTQAVFWTPADWAWTGGLMDALLPTLYFGRPILATQGRFAPEKAFELMQAHGVTHAFLFPTALKAMMKAVPEPSTRYQLKLQAIMSAGEAVGDAVFNYCQQQMGVTVNEMFGQTEINYVVGNC